jgi:branched-chain amino acid transport system ATP-binding protein
MAEGSTTLTDILTVNHLEKSFGHVKAVNDLSFEVKEGEILGMMGPNGAGKTTVFNLLTGVFKPDKGEILFKGKDITHLPPAKRCHRGIGRTYQIPCPFDRMSVFENLLVGAVHGGRLSERRAREEANAIMELTGLTALRNHASGELSLLNRKRLEVGRALATQPSLILLDEVAGGLTEAEVHQVLEIVRKTSKKGVTIIWIEHILMMMSEGVDRLLVIAEGAWLHCGDPKVVMNSKEVLTCYLGAEEE